MSVQLGLQKSHNLPWETPTRRKARLSHVNKVETVGALAMESGGGTDKRKRRKKDARAIIELHRSSKVKYCPIGPSPIQSKG